jgi:hypothetical protein
MMPLGLEAWPLRLATILVRHDRPLFEYSPVSQKLELALPLVAVVSIGTQSQQRRTVSSPFAMVTIAVARQNRQLDRPGPLVIAIAVRPEEPQIDHSGFARAELPVKVQHQLHRPQGLAVLSPRKVR